MVGHYGEKARCWSNYLKLCIEHKTFSADHDAMEATEEEVGWMCSPLSSIVEHFAGLQNPEDLADIKG